MDMPLDEGQLQRWRENQLANLGCTDAELDTICDFCRRIGATGVVSATRAHEGLHGYLGAITLEQKLIRLRG